MTYKYMPVIEKEQCQVITLTADQLLLLVIECPLCGHKHQHDVIYVGNWLNYHAECPACLVESLLPNYDWDEEIDAMNPLAWIDQDK